MFKKNLAVLAAVLMMSTVFAKAEFIDLSHELDANTPRFPNIAPFKVLHAVAETAPQGFYVAHREFSLSEHTGTHMDAPNHFAKNHPGVDKVKLSQLIGPAIMLDVRKAANANPDYQISIADFEQWEASHGPIAAGSIVLLNTGYAAYWSDAARYAGVKKSSKELHFPGLDPKAADWLVSKKQIKAIGIDTFSIDYGQSKDYKSHQILTRHDIPIFENVASMQALPADHFTVYALPAKIKDGTAAPLRIVAVTG